MRTTNTEWVISHNCRKEPFHTQKHRDICMLWHSTTFCHACKWLTFSCSPSLSLPRPNQHLLQSKNVHFVFVYMPDICMFACLHMFCLLYFISGCIIIRQINIQSRYSYKWRKSIELDQLIKFFISILYQYDWLMKLQICYSLLLYYILAEKTYRKHLI